MCKYIREAIYEHINTADGIFSDMECVACSQPLTSQGGESEGGTCTDELSQYYTRKWFC
jgi:hypothetical protein